MNARNPKYSLGGLALIGLLAGCSGSGSQSGITPPAMSPAQSHSTPSIGIRASKVKADGTQSVAYGVTMRPGAHPHHGKVNPLSYPGGTGPLLFVSDAQNNLVNVYTYASGTVSATPIGQLTGFSASGFSGPNGLCEGKSQAPGATKGKSIVWVTNTGNEQLFGYLRGQTTPALVVNTYHPSPGYFPTGCSLDPVTGNLAVSNFEDVGTGVGNVSIFTPTDQAASNGSPSHVYYAPDMWHYYFLGYDGSGNLFADGVDNSGSFVLDELPGGVGPGFTLTTETSSGGPLAINFPGGIEYDSATKYMAVVDQIATTGPNNSKQYEFQIAGSIAKQKKNTPFDNNTAPYGPATDIVQQWLDVKTSRVFAPDSLNDVLSLYQHTSGGGCGNPCYPTVIRQQTSPGTPVGSALMRH